MEYINNESQLIAGQFYIRAIQNYYGDAYVSVYRVLGKPFGAPDSRKVNVISVDGYSCEYYLSDFGVAGAWGNRLLRYDAKTYAFIMSIINDKKAFFHWIRSESSDCEFMLALLDWERTQFLDSSMFQMWDDYDSECDWDD